MKKQVHIYILLPFNSNNIKIFTNSLSIDHAVQTNAKHGVLAVAPCVWANNKQCPELSAILKWVNLLEGLN